MVFGLAPASAQDGRSAGRRHHPSHAHRQRRRRNLARRRHRLVSPASRARPALQPRARRHRKRRGPSARSDARHLRRAGQPARLQRRRRRLAEFGAALRAAAKRRRVRRSARVQRRSDGRYRLGVSVRSRARRRCRQRRQHARARRRRAAPSTGNIEYEGDIDWYRFSARTGNRYRDQRSNGARRRRRWATRCCASSIAKATNWRRTTTREGSLNSALEFIPRANGDVFIEARGYGDGYTGALRAQRHRRARCRRDSIGNSTATRAAASASAKPSTARSTSRATPIGTASAWKQGQSYRFTLNSARRQRRSAIRCCALHDAGRRRSRDGRRWRRRPELVSRIHRAIAPATTSSKRARFAEGATGGYTLTARAGDVPGDAATDASAERRRRLSRRRALARRRSRLVPRQSGRRPRHARRPGQHGRRRDALGDPYLVLYGPDGAEIARDDDGGEGLNAWLEYQATAAGAYYVEARGFIEDAEGRYALSITPRRNRLDPPTTAESLSANGECAHQHDRHGGRRRLVRGRADRRPALSLQSRGLGRRRARRSDADALRFQRHASRARR